MTDEIKWKLVPEEPTYNWIIKYCHLTNRDPAGTQWSAITGEITFFNCAKDEIHAMLAAAPEIPQTELSDRAEDIIRGLRRYQAMDAFRDGRFFGNAADVITIIVADLTRFRKLLKERNQ